MLAMLGSFHSNRRIVAIKNAVSVVFFKFLEQKSSKEFVLIQGLMPIA